MAFYFPVYEKISIKKFCSETDKIVIKHEACLENSFKLIPCNVDMVTVNHQVGGVSPSRGAKQKKGFIIKPFFISTSVATILSNFLSSLT